MSAKDANFTVSAAQVVTTAAAQSGAVVPTETYEECEVFLIASAVGGTTPSVTPVLEISPDGTNWFTHTTGTAMTTNGNQVIKASTNIGRYARVNYTLVTGTTPTFTFNTVIHCKKDTP